MKQNLFNIYLANDRTGEQFARACRRAALLGANEARENPTRHTPVTKTDEICSKCWVMDYRHFHRNILISIYREAWKNFVMHHPRSYKVRLKWTTNVYNRLLTADECEARVVREGRQYLRMPHGKNLSIVGQNYEDGQWAFWVEEVRGAPRRKDPVVRKGRSSTPTKAKREMCDAIKDYLQAHYFRLAVTEYEQKKAETQS